jgi:hypothetical protein
MVMFSRQYVEMRLGEGKRGEGLQKSVPLVARWIFRP